ncbi:MAG: tetraacyldisaccharide 4'-kinase [Bacteroidales bacterium]|nr:tetraacyldisaccharide 4'-kinase [Bacteroidales bacterium]
MRLRTVISWLFFPLTMWYGVVVAVRNWLYDTNIISPSRNYVATIGVGNLSTGGTGKSPMVDHLLSLLEDKYATAMISRGYKRKSKGFLIDDGQHDPTLLGDEPAMIGRKHPRVQVAVCKSRSEAIQRLIDSDNKPQVVVMDDVYQHRRINPSVSILLTEYQHPFFNDHILPFGNLREGKRGSQRASIVVVTKTPRNLNPIRKHGIIQDLKLRSCQKVFFSCIDYGELITLDGKAAGVDLRRVDNALVVTGIAHPKPMIDEIRSKCKAEALSYPDHYDFSSSDIKTIRHRFEAMAGQNKVIVTTEKDAERLRLISEDLPIYVLPMKVGFLDNAEATFNDIIESIVKENISFISKLHTWQ